MMNKKGFTLIELLVVMAIILILAGLLTPGLFKAKQQAGKVSCANNMKQIGTALQLYASKWSDTYPASANTLFTDGEVDDATVLKCPVSQASYGTFSTQPGSTVSSNSAILTCTAAGHGGGAAGVSLYMGGYVKIK